MASWSSSPHDNGTQTYYGHNSSLLVSAGQKVYKGQQIAKAGSTGRSTGVHCHFEVRVRGSSVNPLSYLPDWMVRFREREHRDWKA